MIITIKNIIEEDFVNFKLPSMFIGFPNCTFKCEKDCGIKCCQNSDLVKSRNILFDTNAIIDRYLDNYITKSIVFGGLEPFDSWNDMYNLIKQFRQYTRDYIVIYTGYNKNEIKDKIQELKSFDNIIIKFGRFIPNQKSHFDKVLGVKLNSDNQYAEIIS